MKINTYALLLLTAGLSLMVSCRNGSGSSSEVAVRQDSIKVSGLAGELSFKSDCPVDTASEMTKTINKWISEMLGGSYKGKFSETMPVGKFYIDKYRIQDSTEMASIVADFGEPSWSYVYDASFKKIGDEKKFVTFEYSIYEFTGGAHGMTTAGGQTFRKSDNGRVDWSIVENPDSSGFQNLLTQGLMKYFGTTDSKELSGFLLLDMKDRSLPLPQCPPCFTADGVKVIYGQYEIAPYAAGISQFTIPYSDIEKYLTEDARALMPVAGK